MNRVSKRCLQLHRRRATETEEPAAEEAGRQSGAEPGVLYVVSTPIGNLRDITLRALDVLKSVDLVAAEDTRHSRTLFTAHGISTPMVSYHDFNKVRQTPKLLRELKSGRSVALISDAGTPGISDPGYYLIRAALQEDIPVQAIPGPTALIPALVVSGLPVHRFVFEGFPPAKKGRQRFFASLAEEPRTIVLYESPHRLRRTLEDILRHWGNREVVIARELTKKFEEVLRGRADELLARMEEKKFKGEIVLVIEGKPTKDVQKA